MTDAADAELLARQDRLQREACELADDLRLDQVLARAGRVMRVGSVVTGLMVWRDLDVVLDAPGLSAAAAFEAMLPLLARSRTARYADDAEDARHYFVLRLLSRTGSEWKLDVSFFVAGVPHGVAAFQADVRDRLTPETRLVVLRLKDAWLRNPSYPEVVGGFEICDAVLNHGVRTLSELDTYLRARGLPVASSRLGER
jgi:hypothetical protein